jgi:hypothetical protein
MVVWSAAKNSLMRAIQTIREDKTDFLPEYNKRFFGGKLSIRFEDILSRGRINY